MSSVIHKYGVGLGAIMLACMLLSSCVTRTEYDSYTITVRDTTIHERVHNAPGADNGVVFPSSRTTQISRQTISYDSTYERLYPKFLRMGAIEVGGFITGAAGPGIGSGLFGIYTHFDSSKIIGAQGPRQNSIFKGQLARILPVEYRLRWFDDAPDWTIGWNAYESIAQSDDKDYSLKSYGANVYIRKRYWFRTKPPYLFATPFFGLSLYPNVYANIGGELHFGSFGGFNLRAYLGMAAGTTWPQPNGRTITTPYIGFGVSALDFVNKVSETEQEWKDYIHSAIEVSFVEFDLLDALAKYPNLFSRNSGLPFTGVGIQLATAHFPLTFADGNFWAGTSLMKFFALGYNQALLSVLPLRFGYRHYMIAEDLTIEPFVEANYYPSSFLNIGGRLKLNSFRDMTVGLIVGYALGSTGAFYPKILIQDGSLIPAKLNSIYLGISIGLKDRYNTQAHVRALEKLHENE